MSEMLSRSTCRPCSARSALVASTTASESALRLEMISCTGMLPMIERSEPSSDCWMICVSEFCCERKRWAARRTPSAVPETLKFTEAWMASLMKFLSTPSTAMPIWRCSSETRKPCCRIGQMKTRPPMTTRWPASGSAALLPAPRPTMTVAEFGGTRLMRPATKPKIASATMTRAITAKTVTFSLMKFTGAWPFSGGVRWSVCGCGGVVGERHGPLDAHAGALHLDHPDAGVARDGRVGEGEARLDLVRTVEAHLARGGGDVGAADAVEADGRGGRAVFAAAEAADEQLHADEDDDADDACDEVGGPVGQSVPDGDGARGAEHDEGAADRGARERPVEEVEDLVEDEREDDEQQS